MEVGNEITNLVDGVFSDGVKLEMCIQPFLSETW